MRNVLLVGLVGGVIYLGAKLFGAKRLSDKSVVRTLNPRIHKVTFSGISLATDIVVDNPTNASVQITKPVIKLLSKGKYLASSVPEQGIITISPIGQTSLGTILIEVPWMALTPLISNLVNKIPQMVANKSFDLKSLGVPLEYNYTMYVNNLFYESSPTVLV